MDSICSKSETGFLFTEDMNDIIRFIRKPLGTENTENLTARSGKLKIKKITLQKT